MLLGVGHSNASRPEHTHDTGCVPNLLCSLISSATMKLSIHERLQVASLAMQQQNRQGCRFVHAGRHGVQLLRGERIEGFTVACPGGLNEPVYRFVAGCTGGLAGWWRLSASRVDDGFELA
jgi:hypothetical protein